jgi:hypothetical protein
MFPPPELRLAALIRSVTGVIGPAIDPNNGLARIQCQQLVEHLQQLLRQSSYLGAYQEIEYDAAIALGRAVLAEVVGVEQLVGPAARLRMLIDGKGVQPDKTGLADRTNIITGAIEDLLRHAGQHADPDRRSRLVRLAVAAGSKTAMREQARLDPAFDMAQAIEQWKAELA